jgi:hypothetical protein
MAVRTAIRSMRFLIGQEEGRCLRSLALVLGAVLTLALAGVSRAQFWCWDADSVQAEVSADTLRIDHLASLYNCCPDPLTYDIQVGDATIFIVEHTEAACDCDCCMDVSMAIDDVPPGPWNILFRWFDLEIGQWMEVILQIAVPDVGQPLEPVLEQVTHTDCLAPSWIPDLEEQTLSWGCAKAIYR